MWANATIRTTDLEIMPFRAFAAGVVNTGWSRPLAKSRTSGNQSVLVLENVSLETYFQKIVFCVNALYDARQLGHIASAFSKVREREIANSQNTLCNHREKQQSPKNKVADSMAAAWRSLEESREGTDIDAHAGSVRKSLLLRRIL